MWWRLLLLLVPSVLSFTLYDTGTADDFSQLGVNVFDPHWKYIGYSIPCNGNNWTPATPLTATSPYTVVDAPYFDPGVTGRWVSFLPGNVSVGCFYYSIQFVIPAACNVSSLDLRFVISMDDNGWISFNNNSFFYWPYFGAASPFTMVNNSYLQTGTNEIRIMVNNVGSMINPSGFYLAWLDNTVSCPPVPNFVLYNTGISNTSTILAVNAPDPHWNVIGSSIPCNNDTWNPALANTPYPAFAVYDSPYFNPGSGGSWINAIEGGITYVGCYYYSFLFSVPVLCNVSNLNIKFLIALDNQGYLSVNTRPLFYWSNFTYASSFISIPNSFLQQGSNEVRVIVENIGMSANPAGFYLAWNANNVICQEPSFVLYSTGTDNNFNPLTLGAADTHWTVVGNSIPCNNNTWTPNATAISPSYSVLDQNVYFNPANTGTWINIAAGNTAVGCNYYSLLFSIPGNCNISSLSLKFIIAMDNQGYVSVNQKPIFYWNNYFSTSSFIQVPNSLLQVGGNEVRVILENTGTSPNPAGFFLGWEDNNVVCAPNLPAAAPVTTGVPTTAQATTAQATTAQATTAQPTTAQPTTAQATTAQATTAQATTAQATTAQATTAQSTTAAPTTGIATTGTTGTTGTVAQVPSSSSAPSSSAPSSAPSSSAPSSAPISSSPTSASTAPLFTSLETSAPINTQNGGDSLNAAQSIKNSMNVVGLAVGVSVAALALIILIIVAIFLYRRRQLKLHPNHVELKEVQS
jgi:hypothetical protein